jgi:hypothetical protein
MAPMSGEGSDRRAAQVLQAVPSKHLHVPTRVPDVPEAQLAARLEHARDLAHLRIPLSRVVAVVQSLFRDDHVERAVGEREPAAVAVLDQGALGHPFQQGVLQRGSMLVGCPLAWTTRHFRHNWESGEASAISLALVENARVVLLDEAFGRRFALQLGLPVVETLAALFAAKQDKT